MTKTVKYGIIALLVLVAVIVIYYMFKSTSWTWQAYPSKDVRGSDISNERGITLEQAKANAQKLNAASFVYYPDEKSAWYKSSADFVDGWHPDRTYSLYVHK